MKNVVVVDTSVAIKWVLDESDSNIALALLAEWKKKGLTMLAPSLLAYEATNTLYQNVRRGRITFDTALQGLKKVILAGIEFDFLQDPALSVRALELAQSFSFLATYDAYYLALAEREECEFWTADSRMWKAANGKFAKVYRLEDYHIVEKE